MAHSCFHQQTGDAILHLHHLAHQQVAVAQGSASVPNRSGCHVAFRQKVAAQAVGDLSGIDPIVLLLSRSDGAQHQRMRHLHLLRMRQQMIVDPAGENRCFHGHRPGLRKRLHPAVQFPARSSHLAFLVNLTARILDAVADRLLVNIQSDVIHMSSRSLRGGSLNQPSR